MRITRPFCAIPAATLVVFLLGSATWALGDANANYVTQVYHDLLQMQPDNASLMTWDSYLNGSGSRTTFVLDIEGSTQYLDLVIAGQFNHLLGHKPSSVDLSSFETFLGSNTIEQMQATILGSTEFYNDAGGTNAGFIDAMYADELGRPPGSMELLQWENLLTSGTQRSDVALIVVSSLEYRQDFVEGAFNQFLHRQGSPTEVSTFAGAMGSGTTDQQVVADLLASNEYYNLAQVPEPSSVALTASGVALLLARGRRSERAEMLVNGQRTAAL